MKGRAALFVRAHAPSYYNVTHLPEDTLRAIPVSDGSFRTDLAVLFIGAGIVEGRHHS